MGTRHPQWLAVLMVFASIAASAAFGWHLAERSDNPGSPYPHPWPLQFRR